MDYRDELVRQRIKQMVEQGGYVQQDERNLPLYVALIIIGLVIGAALEYVAKLS
jgi:hypothetical protein